MSQSRSHATTGSSRVAVTVHKPEAPVGVPFADVAVTVVRSTVTDFGACSLRARVEPGGPSCVTWRAAVRDPAGDTEVVVVAVSPVVETDPVGGPDQPDFLNAVVVLETTLSPAELLDLAHRCEREAGRERGERWGPRTLDVDVLAYGDRRLATTLS